MVVVIRWRCKFRCCHCQRRYHCRHSQEDQCHGISGVVLGNRVDQSFELNLHQVHHQQLPEKIKSVFPESSLIACVRDIIYLFLPLELKNTIFHCIIDEYTMHIHSLLLTNTMHTINSLVLQCRVPPNIHQLVANISTDPNLKSIHCNTYNNSIGNSQLEIRQETLSA